MNQNRDLLNFEKALLRLMRKWGNRYLDAFSGEKLMQGL
jgi:hypothetical protein